MSHPWLRTSCTAHSIAWRPPGPPQNSRAHPQGCRRDGARPDGPDRVLDELIDQNATTDPDTDPGYDLATALDVARDELVDDIDIDHLWNPALDGIENDTNLQHHWRMTNLHPTTWFNHFRPGS